MSEVMSQERIKKELLDILVNGVLEVYFFKKNRQGRLMKCTRSPELIPEDKAPFSTKRITDNLSVFDLELKEWRSFNIDSVVWWRDASYKSFSTPGSSAFSKREFRVTFVFADSLVYSFNETFPSKTAALDFAKERIGNPDCLIDVGEGRYYKACNLVFFTIEENNTTNDTYRPDYIDY